MRVTSIYIHVPFCRRKCHYCDFASRPVAEQPELFAAYPELLAQEWAWWQQQPGAEPLNFSPLQTVYFGGGTPSLLEPEQIMRLLSLLPPAQEITLEANPETVELSRLQGYRQAGVNRLSVGVQSFQPELLAAMGRCHSPEQAKQAVDWAKQAGFDNIGIDLIYGLPGQTAAQWQDDLAQALALDTQHLSLYCLTVSPDCAWGREGISPLPDDAGADLAELAMTTLTAAGYHHYEVANFAKPGFESRHNSAYWQRENYLGLGPAAAGCLNNYRWSNTPDTEAWAAALQAGKRPPCQEENLDMDTVLSEAVFLGLRLLDGIHPAEFNARYGVDPCRRWRRQLARMQERGLLEVSEKAIRLTHQGLMLGDRVFAEFV